MKWNRESPKRGLVSPTVQLSKFLIRQFKEATRPARAVTFLEASGTKCGPGRGSGLSSLVLPAGSDVSRFIDWGGGTGDACLAATTVPSATTTVDDSLAAATSIEFLEMSTAPQQPSENKK